MSYKNWKQNWKISNTALTLLFWVQVLFWPKRADFFPKKVLTLAKLRRFFYKTCKIYVVFSETTYLCVFKVSNFSTKFQVFTIILMGFRQENVILPPSPPQNEPLKSPPRLGLTRILVQTQSKIFYRLSTKGFHNLAKNHYFYDSIMGVESSSWVQPKEFIFYFF